jgi:hypothetical protein
VIYDVDETKFYIVKFRKGRSWFLMKSIRPSPTINRAVEQLRKLVSNIVKVPYMFETSKVAVYKEEGRYMVVEHPGTKIVWRGKKG